MKKAEIKVIKDILEEHRKEDKIFFFGIFVLTASILMLFASTNILFRLIVAGITGRYGWLLLKKTTVADELPGKKKE